MSELRFRDLHSADEFRQVMDLEQQVWGFTDLNDMVTLPVFTITVKRGAILIGAYDAADRMVGFVYSIVGMKPGQVLQWSHMLGVLPEWEPWLAAVGLRDLQPAARLSFSRYDEVISAALLGQGVAIGRRPLVDGLLAEGRLVAPWSGELASPRGYFVVLGDAAQRRPAARALRAWLLDTAAREGYASAPPG